MRLRALLCVLALSLAGAVPAAAGATNASVALHLTWRLVTRDIGQLFGDGRYVGYVNEAAPGRPFVVIDDLTGRRTRIDTRGCDPQAMNATWVAFDACSDQVENFRLYNIHSHRWRTLPCNRTCAAWGDWIGIVDVGSQWLALGAQPHDPCGDGIHNDCGNEIYYFENIATGRMRTAPSTSDGSEIDLNSPTLTRRICRPLRAPATTQAPSFPPPLPFFGSKFAVAFDTTGVYVERCGSSAQVPLTSAPYAGSLFGNDEAAALEDAASGVTGVFLPSLRRFTLDLPAFASPNLELGPRHLYLEGQRGGLWRAVFPAPRSRRSPARPR